MTLISTLIKRVVIIIATAYLSGCSTLGASRHSDSEVLRLSMVPSTDPSKVIRESRPLITYLEREIGMKVDLTAPTNYAAVVEAIANGQVDIAYLGGFTYVQASRRSGVMPLVQRERDRNFHSLFITYKGSGINSLGDLRGRSFAFGDVNSTSGHLMPEYYMREANVDRDVIAKAIYTGGHDVTTLAVANRKVDAGAVDEAVYQKMLAERKFDAEQVKIFYITPPFFDYVWAARNNLDQRVKESFALALLKLNSNEATGKGILDLLNATYYVRAEDSNYAKLRKAATEAGLLK